MTFIERAIAKLGLTGVLVILLTVSGLANLWQFRQAGKADARCATRIAELQASADRLSAKAETTALEISRDVTRDAAEEAKTIEVETVKYVDRIREVRVEVPAACDAPMPDGVQDGLREAVRAANRRL